MGRNQRATLRGVACALALAAAACAGGAAEDEGGLRENAGVQRSELRKGDPRAQVGDSNYCNNPSVLCAAGEGDCDSSSQGESGLVCGRGMGVQFGRAAGDACVPAHCRNRRTDADETQTDCGGSCGSHCPPACATPLGSSRHCTVDCRCDVGEGDCDSKDQCVAPLLCGRGRGVRYGLPAGDACVPAHCLDRILDEDESSIDCGGACGACAGSGGGGETSGGGGGAGAGGGASGGGTGGADSSDCLADATYVVPVTGTYSNAEPHDCRHRTSASYSSAITVTISGGVVRVTGDTLHVTGGLSANYRVLQNDGGVLTAMVRYDGISEFLCGEVKMNDTDAGYDNVEGEAHLALNCGSGAISWSALCIADVSADGCPSNYEERLRGSL